MKVETRKGGGPGKAEAESGRVRIIEGSVDGRGLSIGIVVSRFNEEVTADLLKGALSALADYGVDRERIEVFRVPGAFEIPVAIRKVLETGRFDGVIALGAVIRGETPHFDYISDSVTRGVGQIALETRTPIGFGVLTTDTVQQAVDRASPKKFNRGAGAALAVLEMVNLVRKIN